MARHFASAMYLAAAAKVYVDCEGGNARSFQARQIAHAHVGHDRVNRAFSNARNAGGGWGEEEDDNQEVADAIANGVMKGAGALFRALENADKVNKFLNGDW